METNLFDLLVGFHREYLSAVRSLHEVQNSHLDYQRLKIMEFEMQNPTAHRNHTKILTKGRAKPTPKQNSSKENEDSHICSNTLEEESHISESRKIRPKRPPTSKRNTKKDLSEVQSGVNVFHTPLQTSTLFSPRVTRRRAVALRENNLKCEVSSDLQNETLDSLASSLSIRRFEIDRETEDMPSSKFKESHRLGEKECKKMNDDTITEFDPPNEDASQKTHRNDTEKLMHENISKNVHLPNDGENTVPAEAQVSDKNERKRVKRPPKGVKAGKGKNVHKIAGETEKGAIHGDLTQEESKSIHPLTCSDPISEKTVLGNSVERDAVDSSDSKAKGMKPCLHRMATGSHNHHLASSSAETTKVNGKNLCDVTSYDSSMGENQDSEGNVGKTMINSAVKMAKSDLKHPMVEETMKKEDIIKPCDSETKEESNKDVKTAVGLHSNDRSMKGEECDNKKYIYSKPPMDSSSPIASNEAFIVKDSKFGDSSPPAVNLHLKTGDHKKSNEIEEMNEINAVLNPDSKVKENFEKSSEINTILKEEHFENNEKDTKSTDPNTYPIPFALLHDKLLSIEDACKEGFKKQKEQDLVGMKEVNDLNEKSNVYETFFSSFSPSIQMAREGLHSDRTDSKIDSESKILKQMVEEAKEEGGAGVEAEAGGVENKHDLQPKNLSEKNEGILDERLENYKVRERVAENLIISNDMIEKKCNDVFHSPSPSLPPKTSVDNIKKNDNAMEMDQSNLISEKVGMVMEKEMKTDDFELEICYEQKSMDMTVETPSLAKQIVVERSVVMEVEKTVKDTAKICIDGKKNACEKEDGFDNAEVLVEERKEEELNEAEMNKTEKMSTFLKKTDLNQSFVKELKPVPVMENDQKEKKKDGEKVTEAVSLVKNLKNMFEKGKVKESREKAVKKQYQKIETVKEDAFPTQVPKPLQKIKDAKQEEEKKVESGKNFHEYNSERECADPGRPMESAPISFLSELQCKIKEMKTKMDTKMNAQEEKEVESMVINERTVPWKLCNVGVNSIQKEESLGIVNEKEMQALDAKKNIEDDHYSEKETKTGMACEGAESVNNEIQPSLPKSIHEIHKCYEGSEKMDEKFKDAKQILQNHIEGSRNRSKETVTIEHKEINFEKENRVQCRDEKEWNKDLVENREEHAFDQDREYSNEGGKTTTESIRLSEKSFFSMNDNFAECLSAHSSIEIEGIDSSSSFTQPCACDSSFASEKPFLPSTSSTASLSTSTLLLLPSSSSSSSSSAAAAAAAAATASTVVTASFSNSSSLTSFAPAPSPSPSPLLKFGALGNLNSSVNSFFQLLPKSKPPPNPADGKKTVKVKALELAEEKKKEEERKVKERQERKIAREKLKLEKEMEKEADKERVKMKENKNKESGKGKEKDEEVEKSAFKKRAVGNKMNEDDEEKELTSSSISSILSLKRRFETTSDKESLSTENGVLQSKRRLNPDEEIRKKKEEESKKKEEERKRKEEMKRKDEEAKRKEEERKKKEEEEMKKKEEELKKKEEERRKRKLEKEEMEKQKREQKRKKQEEDLLRARREAEEKLKSDLEKQRVELEEKEKRRKATEEAQREKLAAEEEAKRQKRMEMEKAAERRRQEEENMKAVKAMEREMERKRKEEILKKRKDWEEEQRQCALLPKIGEKNLNSSSSSFNPFPASASTSTSSASASALASAAPFNPQTIFLAPGSTALREENHAARFGESKPNPANENKRNFKYDPQPGVSHTLHAPVSSVSNDSIPKWTQSQSQSQNKAKTSANDKTMEKKPSNVELGKENYVALLYNETRKWLNGEPWNSYPISPVKASGQDSDSDDENLPIKTHAQWTRKENVERILRIQQYVDPDLIFPSVHPFVYEDVFGRRNPRRDSDDWSKDLLTSAEKRGYKKEMGFISK